MQQIALLAGNDPLALALEAVLPHVPRAAERPERLAAGAVAIETLHRTLDWGNFALAATDHTVEPVRCAGLHAGPSAEGTYGRGPLDACPSRSAAGLAVRQFGKTTETILARALAKSAHTLADVALRGNIGFGRNRWVALPLLR